MGQTTPTISDMHPFYNFLKKRLPSELPGRKAQLKMSPVPLDPDVVLPRDPTEHAHPSGVLIPLYPGTANGLNVILTLRTPHIRHAGQISFPGGRNESGESLEETALRETEEEIGISRGQVRMAGSITPLYLYRSENQITPFVGFLGREPSLTPNPEEVEEAFAVPLEHLVNDTFYKREKWHLNHASFDVPYWNIHRVPLWGATAMMMSELLELYKKFRNSTESDV